MGKRSDSITLQVLAAGTVIALINAVVALRLTEEPPGGARLYLFLLNVAYWLIWTVFAPVVLAFGSWFRFTAGRRIRVFLIHAVAGVGFAASHLVVLNATAIALHWWIFGAPASRTLQQMHMPTRIHVEWEVTMYWALVGLAHAMAFRAEARERAVRGAQLEAKLAQAQLQALQRQLQPHFLFNTLHTISALVHKDVEAADRMIERLGDLLRMTLGAGDVAEVRLSRELEHVRHYVAIEQANMGRRLTVTIDAAADALPGGVPALLLQPLVENAIRHGLAPRASGGHVRISARRETATLSLRVEDDGVGLRPSGSRRGIGLENTRQRLLQLYGDDHRFHVASPASGGTTVEIGIPFRAVADDVALEVAG
jgi:two-component system LytT family sensor kinase